MELKIIFIYCFCDDLLKALKIKTNPQCKMTHAVRFNSVLKESRGCLYN